MKYLAAYIATIFGANWAIGQFGVVSVGFGLMAPAAVYFVGLAFTFRDLAHERLGRWPVVGAILVGSVLSAFVSKELALASGVAFFVSELADLSVYEPLRKRGWVLAIVASNVVGLVIDSAIFLGIAFGSYEFLIGQIVGKAWMTLIAVVVLLFVRRRAVSVR